MMRFLILFTILLLSFSPTYSYAQEVQNPRTLSDGWHRVKLEGGMVYDGEILSGKMDGKGTLTWLNGSNYSGFF